MRDIKNHLGPLSHVFAGLLPLAWYAALTDGPPPHPGLVIFCALFALAADLDSGASHIGRLFPHLSESIERRYGHRTVTHSLTVALPLVAALTWLLFRDGWIWLTSAYASHIVVDMVIGEEGIPLLWPGPWQFHISHVKPASTGELVITGLLLVGCLTPLFWPTAATSAAAVVPRPTPAPTSTSTPTLTPTPTPTPRAVTVRVDHVRNPDEEILVEAGDVVAIGQPLADLATYRALITTPSPTPTPTPGPTPTLAGLDPLTVAQAEANLALAEARYHAALSTPTPNPFFLPTLEARATVIAGGIQDRRDALYRCEQEGSCDDWRYQVARVELATLEAQAAPAAWRLEQELHPAPDPLAVAIAEAELQVARIRYEAAIAVTPQATPTPALIIASDTGPDETRVYALVAGRVLEVRIASVQGNEATVEIVIALDETEVVASPPGRAAVVRVVDGDTIVVQVDDSEETVRFIGVNTPETKHPEKPVECYGEEASAFTESLLPVGSSVRLELDVQERDKYGRLLAYVWLDGTMVNEVLLSEGYAQVMTIPPNVRYAERFLEAEREARAEGRGLWGACQ